MRTIVCTDSQSGSVVWTPEHVKVSQYPSNQSRVDASGHCMSVRRLATSLALAQVLAADRIPSRPGM